MLARPFCFRPVTLALLRPRRLGFAHSSSLSYGSSPCLSGEAVEVERYAIAVSRPVVELPWNVLPFALSSFGKRWTVPGIGQDDVMHQAGFTCW
jgi:hypothetical protein